MKGEDHRRQRRRFAARLTPVAIGLLVVGVLFADEDGALEVVGLVALAQGIGLAVALVWLAFGAQPALAEVSRSHAS